MYYYKLSVRWPMMTYVSRDPATEIYVEAESAEQAKEIANSIIPLKPKQYYWVEVASNYPLK